MYFGTAGGKLFFKSGFTEQTIFLKGLPVLLQLATTNTAVYGAVIIRGRDLKCLQFWMQNVLLLLSLSNPLCFYFYAHTCAGVLTFYPTLQIFLPGFTAHAHINFA